MQIRKLPRSKLPPSLLEIPQPPKDVYVLGEIEEYFDNPDLVYLAIVGSRKNTTYGKDICEKIIAGLKGYPIVIVSGFAMGIDTIAHKKALHTGLRTLVFPGSGLSKEAMYPKSNIRLTEEVLLSGGCLISEFEPKFKATYWSFPMRNRLMAGISQATLVIEAGEKSGTLITARLAVEYNRELLVVPGSVFSPNSKGTNKLLRQGATPVTSAEEVLEALGFIKENNLQVQKNLFDDLSREEKQVLGHLHEPKERDELLRLLKMPTAQANALLSLMEIKELIKEELGELRAI